MTKKKKDVVDLRWTSRKGHRTGSEGDFRLCIKEESFLPSITSMLSSLYIVGW